MNKINIITIVFTVLIVNYSALAQTGNDTVIFTESGHFNFNFTYSGYTPLIDRLGRPYVYLATKELGLVTFNISNPLNPVPVDSQTVVSLGNLKVTGLAQDNNYLLVSLGDFQGTTQNAGLAIFDFTNPLAPVLLDRWDTTAFTTGTATLVYQGNYAFMGAMQDGVVILDISDKHNIKFVSRIIPDLNFGSHNNVYHSRGLFISGDTLLVADDNGGLRIIDVTDKNNPLETGKYYNGSIATSASPFYNHVYRIGNYAFCSIDFCGFEVVDITNPLIMTGVSLLNPWNCTSSPPPFGSWNGSDGHTNEIAYSPSQSVLMFSGGDSQVLAFDPSDPSQPRIMGAWGSPNDSVGSWGVDVYGNLVAIANVRTFGFPFISNVGGLQLLNWNKILGINKNTMESRISVYPNPVSEKFTIEISMANKNNSVELTDIYGRVVLLSQITGNKAEYIVDRLANGLYFLRVTLENLIYTKKLEVIR